MRGYIGTAVLVALVLATDHWFGAIGVTRFVGLIFLCGCVHGCFAPRITASAGHIKIGELTGWNKAFALVPISGLGLLLVLYAPAITCISTKYKHLCA